MLATLICACTPREELPEEICQNELDGEWADGYYTEYFNYDKQGNIRNFYRWDNADMMNCMYLSYEGNQLTKVTDDGYGPLDYTCKRYIDGADAPKEMFYDENGALIADLDRKTSFLRFPLRTITSCGTIFV